MRPSEDSAKFLRHGRPVTLSVFVSHGGQIDLVETAGAGEQKSLTIKYPCIYTALIFSQMWLFMETAPGSIPLR